MKISATSIDDYLSKTESFEADLREVDKIIVEHAPHLKRQLFSGMGGGEALAYGLISYQSKSMKQPGTWPLLALAGQKNYMALYACAVVDGQYVGEKYGSKLGKVSIGKSCIRFKRLEQLDKSGLIAMLKEIDRRYSAGETLYGLGAI